MLSLSGDPLTATRTTLSTVKRNGQCPCGSGIKFKKCCYRRSGSRVETKARRKLLVTQLTEDGPQSGFGLRRKERRTSGIGYPLGRDTAALKMFLRIANEQGHNVEAIELWTEFKRRKENCEMANEAAFLASAARGKRLTAFDGEQVDGIPQDELARLNDLYPVEALWFKLKNLNLPRNEHITAAENCLSKIESNFWIVPSSAPTPTLLVAKWLLDNSERVDLARKFACLCLGWRYVFRRIDDLLMLAELLKKLSAPRLYWTVLGNLYYDFAAMDNVNRVCLVQATTVFEINNLLDQFKIVNDKEGLFHQYCMNFGFPEHDDVSGRLIEAFGLSGKDYVARVRNHKISNLAYVSEPYDPWLAEDHFQMRHPWYALLEPHERDFIRNGDTGFLACYTSDFSMGCSQWWRVIESVLKRKLIVPLGELIDSNPSWKETDLASGRDSKASRFFSENGLFVNVLADREKRNHMGLTQILILLNKCLSDIQTKKESTSLVRRHSVQHVKERLTEFRWVKGEGDAFADMRSALSPNVLTEQSIQSYRNFSSHDRPLAYVDAIIGRLLAMRILDFIHYPRYCVTFKLEELKQEIAKKTTIAIK